MFDPKKSPLYKAKRDKPALIEVPELQFLMVEGVGNPNDSTDFMNAIQALYGLVYTLKFTLKTETPPRLFSIGPLEGLWWADDMSAFKMEQREDWRWNAMLWVPEFVTQDDMDSAREQLVKKGKTVVDNVRLEKFTEGLCAQVMHIGPYADEAPTIEALHAFIEESGHSLRGKHHEIYLGDPRRAAPEKLRTIIRQPVG